LRFGIEVKQGGIIPTTAVRPPSLVFAAPTGKEKHEPCATPDPAADDLQSVLDPSEMAHVEYGNEGSVINSKGPPYVGLDQQQVRSAVSSVGVFLRTARPSYGHQRHLSAAHPHRQRRRRGELGMMLRGIDWRISHAVSTFGMILSGWATRIMLLRMLDNRRTRQEIRFSAVAPLHGRILRQTRDCAF
jgi:hypothetical protein